MTAPLVKNLDRPDEIREFPNGADALVRVAGHTIGRAEFRPGWRWSNDVRPIARTASCLVDHRGYLLDWSSTAAQYASPKPAATAGTST